MFPRYPPGRVVGTVQTLDSFVDVGYGVLVCGEHDSPTEPFSAVFLAG